MSEEISPNDRKFITNLLTQKNQESLLLSIGDKISKKKNKKPSKRIILITKNRIFFLKPSQNKVKKDIHLLDIQEIKSSTSNEFTIVAKVDNKQFSYGLITNKTDEIINQIRVTFNHQFFGCPEESTFKCTDIKDSRLVEIEQKDLPCGGFVETYQSICDHLGVPPRDDICWDMTNIISSKNIRSFNIGEIELPTSAGDTIRCLLGALKYNNYFKSFNFNNYTFNKEQFGYLAEVLKCNSTVEDLSLNNVGLKHDTMPIIATALSSNKNLALTAIDISNNQIEDKGMTAFSSYVASSLRGIASLDVSNTNCNKAGISVLTNALKKNIKMSSTLSYLNLSGNKMEADGSAGLSSFLASPNTLKTLNISNTTPSMETIVGALVIGCAELKTIDISDNKLTKKEVPHLVRFIGASSTLKHFNLSGTKVPVENLKELVVAITSNIYLQDVVLDLKNNDLGIAGARMLASLATDKLSNVIYLDVSENDFGDEGVSVICDGFVGNSTIKKLILNGNFKQSKTKSRPSAIESVISLLESECPLETLHMTVGNSKSPLKADILSLIYSLATNSSLLELDISGHQMGPKGAIGLGKALQTNKTLHTLIWDDNLTTAIGFAGFQVGLERNLTLKNMPTPLNDIIQCHREPKFQQIWKEIDSCINRNQSPTRAFEGNGGNSIGATNLSFLASGQQQGVEKLLNKIKSIGRKVTDPNNILIVKDAESTEKVIGGIHLIKESIHASLEMELNQKLKDFVQVVNDVINAKKNEMTQQILESMQNTFQSMDGPTIKRLATTIQYGSKDVDEQQIHSTLVKGAGAELSSRAHECFISALDIASDYTYEKITIGLDSVFKDLILEESQAQNEASGATPIPDSPVPTRSPQPTSPPITPQPTPTTNVPPVTAPRTGAAAPLKPANPPPVSTTTTPPVSTTPKPTQPVSKFGAKLSANSAVAEAIARNMGGGAPPIRKPVAPEPEPEPVTPTKDVTPLKSKPVVAPRSTPTTSTPTKTPVKKPSGPSVPGSLSDAPESDSAELTHVTASRPHIASKRKPPTRRPRPPTEN
ncbi:leucine-rich repeat-containing protein [Dictyostelium discoideum AX4]|uniref:Protein CARMIL n=1 Tax=Dictyostelium discoideum TaxID=44689 RepID=CARML_DICDI|nr:leucine-rich repeat-containing protein [Dictyostelium discoideum AX4]Q95VZ3.1 RecName: Full=Protein CARMIL; Short=dDcarmil; AltName: Full=Capping protein, arp2/3 and myosin I linker; AltName: Full=Leucine-rich repeat-containing protein p116; Short=p116 [Dictyostelium discoideum]AAK72255.1 carmil [Dictyostelium discoideum]EAL61172.1 leucine-rich repeat-containing protein [Dictyostelium discoideum AX4]|eukprot:XP_629656.1 leucine-rich repeat-containing protein [Dictyostelium discoideum AX4]